MGRLMCVDIAILPSSCSDAFDCSCMSYRPTRRNMLYVHQHVPDLRSYLE